jgi:hypothetical protein
MTTEVTVATIGLLGILLTLMSSIVTMWFKHRLDRKAYEKKHAFSKTLPAVHEVYSILNTIKGETEASRVLILKAENGGGRPNLGSHLKSSVLYEVFDAPLETVRKLWQNQPLDEDYIKVLNQLIITEEKKCMVNVAKLQKGSLLRDNYEANGVKYSHIYEIAEREHSYLYLSVNYTEGENDAHAKDIERACVNQLRVLFKKNEEL